MAIRLYNAKILTMEHGFDIISGELWIRDGRVAYAGPQKKSGDVWDREINLEGDLVMPGFKNAHTHSAMTFLRSYADDLPLHRWLNEQVFPMEAKLTPRNVYELSRLAIMEYLSSGITANFDMYYFNDEIVRASVDCGFRTVLVSAINDFGGTIDICEQEYNKFNSYDPLISYRLGFHGEYTCQRELLESIAALSGKYKAPVFSHNAETREEVDGCIERHGVTPTQFLDSLGMFEFGGGGYHCVHLTDEDIEIFRNRKLWAVTNPGSNCKLASGIAPLQKMYDAGVNLAIGTDGPASNNCLDMFRELFLATAMQKILLGDASAMDAHAVLEMAVKGGALAMGLTDCDSLAVGKLADIVVLSLRQPNMQPENNITKNIVYSGSKQNVRMTIVAGKILYENGLFNIGVDPAEVYAKANEIIGSMRKG